MYQIAYIGHWETLPETAAVIYEHDSSKLEVMLQGGLDLDAPIQLSEYIKLTPLEIAVFQNDVSMIHFLLEHGVDPGLAEEQPSPLLLKLSDTKIFPWYAGSLSKEPTLPLLTNTVTGLTLWLCRTKIRNWPTT